MKIDELGLAIGDTLQLQLGDDIENRYSVIFYGMNPTGSIIVSAPKSSSDKAIFVREGQPITLRFVSKNVASGFSTSVITSKGRPYPYIHLKIPLEIQTVEVRKGVRIDADIAATVLNKTHRSPALTGRLKSLSCSGARIETTVKTALEGDLISISATLFIEKVKCFITMDCKVTYVKEDEENDLYIYGVNIVQIDDEDLVSLSAYVYQELLRSLHMI